VTDARQRALTFVVIMGAVSLLADMCYEGMRSAVGPYLGLLGASAAAVGFVAGLGELIGYGLRYLTGALADRTGRYWALAFAGYGVNLVAVPLLAVAGSWPMVAALIALERLGKAVRSPAKATLTSFAAREVGAGRAFAIAEAMDQLGGIAGPLLVAGVLAVAGGDRGAYQVAFALLAVPAAACLGVLALARHRYPDPRSLETASAMPASAGGDLRAVYWLYLCGVALVAFGLSDWALLAYHLARTEAVGTSALPVVYAAAMAADAVAAIGVGELFDRRRKAGRSGVGVLAIAVLGAAAFAPLVFAGGPTLALVGVAIWAVGLAATESISKSIVAVLVPAAERGRAYGIYYLVFGAAWWLGSMTTGALYDRDPGWAAVFAASSLVAAGIVLAICGRRAVRRSPPRLPGQG
jgi:MFS family permease